MRLLRSGTTILVAAAATFGASAAATGSSAGADYRGTARSLVPSPQAVKYVKISTSRELARTDAGANLRPGFKSGWNATYERTAPFASLAGSIVVYADQTHARAAYTGAARTACGSRCHNGVVSGGSMKYDFVTGTGVGVDVFNAFTRCRNLYVAVSATGYSPQASARLERDSRALISAIYAKAVSLGMSTCSG